MTDTSFSVRPSNGYDHAHAHAQPPIPHALALPLPHDTYHNALVIDGMQEDDGQISCVCGFADDDGATVACDLCNRWQHQACYYPQYEERQLPEELQHYCVDCRPRPMDVERARDRQREKRGQADSPANGFKRNPSKSHKKKVKDLNGVAVTNGWPLDKSRHDRNSASPRDQPPPPKRPKTSHRHSDSTNTAATTTTKSGHSRKRNASNAVNARRSVSRSPDAPIEQYSEEFLQCYRHDDWKVTDANLHNSIAVTNALSEWLNAPEDDFRKTHGHERTEVLMRWDGQLDDIPGKAELDLVETVDDTVRYGDLHPTWRAVTVKEPVAGGAYLGELKGHVGFKKDYQQDASNRWTQLRHPEPFVFFHPKLPVVIDARHEGTELRYVRRSCVPNARLQILVTDGKDYHFCFMTTQQIEPGVEVAVGWDTSAGLPELAYRTNISPEDMDHLSGWVSTALANCGPCACRLPEGECMMSRFDRRARDRARDDPQPAKAVKSRKRKPGGQHASPATTLGVNSRSGSEIRKVDPDDDATDSRSTSGSVGGPLTTSRDITPNTHYSTNGASTAMPELSERERKKLAKEEEMFRRQEEERAGKNAKKKRSSAGSNVQSTTSSSTAKQSSATTSGISRYVDAGTSRSPGALSSARPAGAGGRRPKTSSKQSQQQDDRPSRRAIAPTYVNAETQCDLDLEEAEARPKPLVRRPYLSTRQRLLERCARNNNLTRVRITPTAAPSTEPPSATLSDEDSKMDVDGPQSRSEPGASPTLAAAPTGPALSVASSTVAATPAETPPDTEMPDVEQDRGERRKSPSQPQPAAPSSATEDTDTNGHGPPTEPPVPPWPHRLSSSEGSEAGGPTKEPRPPYMHLQMPPPSAGLSAPPQPPLSAGLSSVASASPLTHSPLTGLPPLLPSAVASSVAPSPARKKMSLSDYTRRSKAKDKDQEGKPERDSSPASTASGPVMASSGNDAANDGSAMDDDVKMEDVTESAPSKL